MTPDYDLVVEGVSITNKVRGILLELSVSDEAGQESDTCKIRLDDRGELLEIPRKGAKISISMGYKETGLTFMGLFVVDEIELTRSPREMNISGRAADMTKTMKQQKTRGFDKKTVGQIVKEVAADHSLEPKVSSKLASRFIPFTGQTEESDIHFLTRLAKEHGAVSKPANGKWLFVEKGTGKSASGADLPAVRITSDKCLSWAVRLKDRPQHKETQSPWHDRKSGTRKIEKAPGSKGDAINLTRFEHGSKDEAKWGAQAKAKDLKSSEATLSAQMIGDTAIVAESPATTSGLRRGIPTDWILNRAEHTISNGGYLTSIEAKLKP